MSQHIGPRTISATGGSIKRVGNYRIHTFPSELVTDGLVLNLDAGDPRSYPGSGTTWTDLSGNGNNVTSATFPTYQNTDGGRLNFDASDDQIFGTAPILTTVTCEAWVKPDGSPLNGFHAIFQKEGGYSGGAVYGLRIAGNKAYAEIWYSDVNGEQIAAAGTTTIPDNATQWYHIVSTYDSNYNLKLYVNGVLEASSVGTRVPRQNSSQLSIGIGDARRFKGNLSAMRIYNRALSAAEVAQNYDALKVRYSGYTNTFTPLCAGGSGKVEVLCVAGGGGGGEGGGGAGGLLYNSAFTVNSNTGIGLTVGAGGTGSNGYLSGKGSNGGNSLFSTLTSIGGGAGGAGNPPTIGNTGGSGGGTSAAFGALATSPAAGTVGQGYSGGAQSFGSGSLYASGGGGGAGGNGGIGNTSAVGGSTGGVGLSYAISGISQFYAGGGGGNYYISQFYAGLGGSGVGGGSGIATTIGTNAIPNTGSGGGGSAYNVSISGNGSNGIVIVRYPATDYNVELLIVGGGGGGGYCKLSDGGGGGGGAGGLIYYSSYPVSAGTKYSVTVGAGGTGSTVTNGSVNGANGSNSIFGPIIAIGGGGGGSTQNASVLNIGGSGGGAGSDGGNDNGGSGTSGQGNNGGNNNTGNLGAGGGGAGAVGTSVTAGTDVPNGGIGLAYAITGTSTYYAGGGGGGKFAGGSGNAGTGGLGGGGNGGKGAAGSNGTANTGGGGGGGGMVGGITGNAGAGGGSGIIIIAYQGPQRGIGGTVNTTSRPGYTLHTFTTTGTDFFIP